MEGGQVLEVHVEGAARRQELKAVVNSAERGAPAAWRVMAAGGSHSPHVHAHPDLLLDRRHVQADVLSRLGAAAGEHRPEDRWPPVPASFPTPRGSGGCPGRGVTARQGHLTKQL